MTAFEDPMRFDGDFSMTIAGAGVDADTSVDVVNPATHQVFAPFGLGGAVWCRDVVGADGVARRLDTGTAWVNQPRQLSPYAPFASHKPSGFGAENGLEGLLEFTVPQSIFVGRPEG